MLVIGAMLLMQTRRAQEMSSARQIAVRQRDQQTEDDKLNRVEVNELRVEVEVIPEFNGTWVLDSRRSESIGPQLEALGVPWWKRKAAETAVLAKPLVTVSLNQPEQVWREHIKMGGLLEIEEMIKMDGSAMLGIKQGFRVEERTSVEEEGRCVVTRIAYVDRAQHSEIRRYILNEDSGKTYMVKNRLTLQDGSVLNRTSYFQNAEASLQIKLS